MSENLKNTGLKSLPSGPLFGWVLRPHTFWHTRGGPAHFRAKTIPKIKSENRQRFPRTIRRQVPENKHRIRTPPEVFEI